MEKDQARWERLPVMLEELDVDLARRIRGNGSGTVRLVHFWSTTCAPCLAEFPDLIDTYRRFQNRNFDLVTISLDPVEAESKVRRILQKHHAAVSPRVVPALRKEERKSINYRFAGENPDEMAEVIDAEWSGALPHSLLLSPAGEIVWRHTGSVEPLELRRQILRALADEPEE